MILGLGPLIFWDGLKRLYMLPPASASPLVQVLSTEFAAGTRQSERTVGGVRGWSKSLGNIRIASLKVSRASRFICQGRTDMQFSLKRSEVPNAGPLHATIPA